MKHVLLTTALVLSAGSALAQSDPCKKAHSDQASCDADTKTGGGCTWCKCAALPSSCWTKTNSKKLPASVYQCDSGGDDLASPPASPAVFKTWSSPVTTTCVGAACSGSSSTGTMAYSAAQNMSAWRPAAKGGAGVPTIVDFNARAAFFLTGEQGTCAFACPLAGVSNECNEQTNMNEFCMFDYVHKIKYVDSDESADHYHINSGIGPLVMAQYDYYMRVKTGEPQEVLFQAQPFGKWLGNITTHFHGFSTAEPDASLFDVPNRAHCQQGSDAQCGNIDAKNAILRAGLVLAK